MNKNTFKSVGVIVLGFLVVVILSTATDAVLHKAGVYSDSGYLSHGLALLATIYRTIYTVLAGYIVARLSPAPSMRDVKILGVIGTLGGLLGLISTWDKGLGPVWYPIALTVLAYISIWWGGKIAKR